MRLFFSVIFLGFLISACNGGENPNTSAYKELAAKVDSVAKPQLDTLHFMVDDRPCLAVIDKRYRDFKHRADFPLSLFVTITTQSKDSNGHPDQNEARIQGGIENDILNSLNMSTVNAYIGKTTMNGFRDLIFYIKASDQEKITQSLLQLKKQHPRIKEFTFDKDPEWDAVSEFFEALEQK